MRRSDGSPLRRVATCARVVYACVRMRRKGSLRFSLMMKVARSSLRANRSGSMLRVRASKLRRTGAHAPTGLNDLLHMTKSPIAVIQPGCGEVVRRWGRDGNDSDWPPLLYMPAAPPLCYGIWMAVSQWVLCYQLLEGSSSERQPYLPMFNPLILTHHPFSSPGVLPPQLIVTLCISAAQRGMCSSSESLPRSIPVGCQVGYWLMIITAVAELLGDRRLW